eukprot:Awhi_evm1s13711
MISRKHNSTPFAIYYGKHNLWNIADDENSLNCSSWLHRLDVYADYVNPAVNIKSVDYHNAVAREFAKKNKHLRRPLRNYRVGDYVKIIERD